MTLIFLSFSEKDANRFRTSEITERLIDFPKIDKVANWQRDMPSDFMKYMNDNVGACDIFLIFCSQNALNSRSVELEWMAALRRDKIIIPIYEEEMEIPTLLTTKLGVQFREDDFEGFMDDLHRLILKRLNLPVPPQKRELEHESLIKNLENLIGKNIPRVKKIEWHTIGFKIEKDTIVGLSLYNCGLTSIPPSFQKLISLRKLLLYGNKIQELPDFIGKLRSLRVINLYRNLLTSLPESIGKLEHLENLNLGKNPIKSLPVSIGNLKSLKMLYLYDNDLKSLPSSFGSLKSLQHVKLQRNHLTELPETVGNLRSILELYIYSNQIKSLPKTLLNLPTLRVIWVEHNPLDLKSQQVLEKLKAKGVEVIESTDLKEY